jgi:hypothetical protein
MLNNFQKSRKKLQKFAKLHENFANFSYLSIYRGQLTPPPLRVVRRAKRDLRGKVQTGQLVSAGGYGRDWPGRHFRQAD